MGRYPHQREFGDDSDEDLAKAMEAMQLTDTLELAQRRITEISGGEAQRVIIARAHAAGRSHGQPGRSAQNGNV